ncbi:hypothetical protein H0H87_010202 [Tephrocybe sp. NHM501043]|nr:hypothetical protein H0H87_010202 [Tephrocybe sp. NHM501043]
MQSKQSLIPRPRARLLSLPQISTAPDTIMDDAASDVSRTLSVDELRWLHASEAIGGDINTHSVVEPTEAGPGVNADAASFIETGIDGNMTPSRASDTTSATPGPNATRDTNTNIRNINGTNTPPPPSSFKLKLKLAPADSYPPFHVTQAQPNLKPTLPTLRTQSLHRGRTWDRHRHFHLLDAPEIGMSISTSSSTTTTSSSGSGSSDITPTPTMMPSPRKACSSLIPAPIPIATSTRRPSPTTPTATTVSRSLPTKLKASSAPRTEWIYRHPKPRPVRAPPLSVSTSASTSSTARATTRPQPPSPLALSRTPSASSTSTSTPRSRSSPTSTSSSHSHSHSYYPPTYTRARTRSSTSRSGGSPISITARTSTTALRPRVRPQTGYHAHHHHHHHHHALGHANANASADAAGKRPVHSVLPARSAAKAKEVKNAKEREREGERSIWAMLRMGDKDAGDKLGEKEKAKAKVREGAGGAEEEYGVEKSPGQRILDIVNAAERESDLLKGQDSGMENAGKQKEKENGVTRLKRGTEKGLALVMGRGRASPPSTPAMHKRSGSISSNISNISAPILSSSSNAALFAQPLITQGPPQVQANPSRNRASSASSNSTASTASAQSASTAATSPSPSVPASPKPGSTFPSSTPFNPPSTSTPPTKGILSR